MLMTGLVLMVAGCAAPPRIEPGDITYEWPEGGWRPDGALAAIPLAPDCEKTQGEATLIERTFAPPFAAIYFCPDALREIDTDVADAAHFFIVREYGFYALRADDAVRVDAWAAQQLVAAPRGAYFLQQTLAYLLNDVGEAEDARLGTPRQRAERIARAAGMEISSQ